MAKEFCFEVDQKIFEDNRVFPVQPKYEIVIFMLCLVISDYIVLLYSIKTFESLHRLILEH